MLTQMLEESGSLVNLSPPEKLITLKLANKFQSNTQYLFMEPEELRTHTQIGTVEQWRELLLMQETQNFIKGQMSFLSQIAQRKTFAALVQSAIDGNTQASKQITELSGVMNAVDNNKVIILHHIPRATTTIKEEIKS